MGNIEPRKTKRGRLSLEHHVVGLGVLLPHIFGNSKYISLESVYRKVINTNILKISTLDLYKVEEQNLFLEFNFFLIKHVGESL